MPNIKDMLVNVKIGVVGTDRPKVATPKEIAERVGLIAEQIQLELKKSHPDMNRIDWWLWEIRHASVPLAAQFK